MEFNLIIERWIPVLLANGRAERVGIRTALLEAGRIRQIAASNPMDNVALLRFLLAVMMWCKPELSDEERRQLDGAAGIPEGWLRNLGSAQQPNSVFNLLGNAARFMQASARAANNRPVADLYHELPGGTNKAHFRHIRDFQNGACAGCVAIGLVRLPVAITGKGAGKHPGINGDPPMYFMPVGGTLRKTLMLNWPSNNVRGDQPCWFDSPQAAQERIVGLMEGFTWTSRQFRIADDGLKSGTCMVCGTETNYLIVGLKELNEPNGRNGLSRCDASRWRDPHIIYTDKKKPCQAEDAEKDLPKSSGQWRNWLAGLLADSANGLQCPRAVAAAANRFDGRASIHVTGFAMQSSDKSVESCTCYVNLDRAGGEGPANLKSLDEAVGQLLDPKVTLNGRKLPPFKAKHPLRVIRSIKRPLSDTARAAMADRLPGLESAMFDNLLRKRGMSASTPCAMAKATGWPSVVAHVVNATAPGSPLRRREAMARTQSALDAELGKATTAPNEAPWPQNDAKPNRPRRPRKKKEGAS